MTEKKYRDLLLDVICEMKGVAYKYESKGIFFTEEAAKTHLRCNNYHYTPSVRIFGVHAWRNPEMELIFKIILNHEAKDIKK